MLSIDHQLSLFLVENRSGFWTAIFSSFSFLGNWQFVVLAVLSVIIVLIVKKQMVFIFPLLLSILSSEAVTFLGKWYFQRSRPAISVFSETGFSFPSGHATVAVSFFGFLAFMILKLNNGRRSGLVYAITAMIIIMIGLARIYLGAHYLSDVLIGFVIGSGGLLLAIAWVNKLLLDGRVNNKI